MPTPTDDLVARLRADAVDHRYAASDLDCRPEDTANWQHAENCDEAADAIERLQAENEALRAAQAPSVETVMRLAQEFAQARDDAIHGSERGRLDDLRTSEAELRAAVEAVAGGVRPRLPDAAIAAMKTADFPAVVEAKRLAKANLDFYTSMMEEAERAGPSSEQP